MGLIIPHSTNWSCNEAELCNFNCCTLLESAQKLLAHDTNSGRLGRLIGSLAYILAVWGRGTEKMAGGSPGTDSQDLATILDPFRAIFVDLGPDRLSAT